jgi:hypothetical protein
MALLPTYGQGTFAGLQAVNTGTGTVMQLSNSVGAEPDSAAVDISTNLVVIADEFTANDYIVNLQEVIPSGSQFAAPTTVFQINAAACTPLWTLTSIENVNHILFVGTEFDNCLGAGQLPSAIVSGSPPVPTSFVWGKLPAPPDGTAWNNGADPHGIAVFTSVVNQKPYGFLVDSDGPWLARIDLQGLAGAPALIGGYPGQVDVTPFVSFFKTL